MFRRYAELVVGGGDVGQSWQIRWLKVGIRFRGREEKQLRENNLNFTFDKLEFKSSFNNFNNLPP